MKFSKHDLKMFNAAKKEAKKSEHHQYKIGCVIEYKGHIIGSGHNSHKTHPLQKEFNRFRNFKYSNNYSPDSLHAEIAAICSVSYPVGINVKWNKVRVYVCRVRKDGKIACSRPCKACMNYMRSLGIRKIFFTEDNNSYGYIEAQ